MTLVGHDFFGGVWGGGGLLARMFRLGGSEFTSLMDEFKELFIRR
jgi:hypothetical protein